MAETAVEGGPRDMDVTDDDLMMMGGLDDDLLNLDSFMPTNEELVADADLNMRRMASSGSMEMDITIPKMSDRLQEHLKNHPVVLNHDDDFNVDFDDASVVSKKDKTPIPSPAKTFQAIGKQKTPVPATTAPSTQPDEEEEELLVIPTKKVIQLKEETTNVTSVAQGAAPGVVKSPEKASTSTESPLKSHEEKANTSPAKPVDSPTKATTEPHASTTPATPSAAVPKSPEAPKSAEPAKQVIHIVDNKNTDNIHKPLTKQKSREEMLPGKLQKQVSEARLQAQTTAVEDNMTDIEAMLLGDHPHPHPRSDAPLDRETIDDDAAAIEAEADELDEDVEELDIIHEDTRRNHRYSDRNLLDNHEPNARDDDEEDLYLEQDEHFDDDAALKHHQQTERKKDIAPNKKHRVNKPRKLVVTAQLLQTSAENTKDTAARLPASSSSSSPPPPLPTQQPQTQQRAYQHPATQARFTVGGKQLSLAEAKLYGLVDADGSFKHPMQQLSSSGGSVHGSDNTNNSKGQRQKILQMSQPRADYANDIDLQEERPSFQPQRSEAAMKAMKNPRLGYDFMDRLGQGGSFLDRLQTDSHTNQRYSKAELDVMEADYAVKLDKLQCPMCHKEQSFVEMIENRRVCGPCQVKFVKLKVSSGQRFVQQNAEREAKRLAKLAKIDEEMYGMLPKPSTAVKLPAIPSRTSNVQSNGGNKGKATGAPPLLPPGPGDQNTDPHASSNQPTNKNHNSNKSTSKNNQDKKNINSSSSNGKRPTSATATVSSSSTGPIMVPTTAASTAASVQQLVQLHQQKQQAVTQAFAALQQPVHETSNTQSSTKHKTTGGSAAGVSTAPPPPSTREPKDSNAGRSSKAAGNSSLVSNAKTSGGVGGGSSDPVARKMDRLMQLD